MVQATVNGELKATLRIDGTTSSSDQSFSVTASNSNGAKTLTVNIKFEKSFETVTNLPPEFEQSLPAEILVEVVKDPSGTIEGESQFSYLSPRVVDPDGDAVLLEFEGLSEFAFASIS